MYNCTYPYNVHVYISARLAAIRMIKEIMIHLAYETLLNEHAGHYIGCNVIGHLNRSREKPEAIKPYD